MARRVLHDRYFKQAKREGYVARSAYKLLELNDRRRLIRAGDFVLDMGCVPGSWLQVAAELVGPGGVVVGVDLQRTDLRDVFPGGRPNVHVFEGDITAIDVEVLLEPIEAADPTRGLFDVVISDMAPKTIGAGDDLRSVHLCRDVLARLPELLGRGGKLAMKVLEGGEFPDLLKETKAVFAEVGAIKPKASRDVSRETYVVASGYGLEARRKTRRKKTGDGRGRRS
ncbi:MAG: RlmE family RNA methyltransferase [Planctomycetota bacterium]